MAITFSVRTLPTGGKLIAVPVPGARAGVCMKMLEVEAIARGLIEDPRGEGAKKQEPVRNKARRGSANKGESAS